MIQAIARMIDNTAPGKIIGHFYSHKTACLQPYESVLEQMYFYILESDASIVSYAAQPVTISYFFDGRLRRYTPDVQLYYSTHENIGYVEVKPTDVAQFWTESGRLESIAAAMQDLGANFYVVTSTQINSQPRLRNAILLHRYGGLTVPMSAINKAKDYVQGNPGCTVKQVSKYIASNSQGIDAVYAMVFRQLLNVDMGKPLNINSGLNT